MCITHGQTFIPVLLFLSQFESVNLNDLSESLHFLTVLIPQVQDEQIKLCLKKLLLVYIIYCICYSKDIVKQLLNGFNLKYITFPTWVSSSIDL